MNNQVTKFQNELTKLQKEIDECRHTEKKCNIQIAVLENHLTSLSFEESNDDIPSYIKQITELRDQLCRLDKVYSHLHDAIGDIHLNIEEQLELYYSYDFEFEDPQ